MPDTSESGYSSSATASFRLASACLIMGAFCGLLGFMVVYHYATLERPTLDFAIVVDAGSTQTRSSLFSIQLDVPSWRKWTDNQFEPAAKPLAELVKVRQLSQCVNGAPLASVDSELKAGQLINKCLDKFADYIKRLDFLDKLGGELIASGNPPSEPRSAAEEREYFETFGEEWADRVTMEEHRMNSVTRLHLGATAGMRALRELNATRAMEKVSWVKEALASHNGLASDTPLINQGFVGILEGADEAGFGWVSTNFVLGRLAIHRPEDLLEKITQSEHQKLPSSSGTIELGGASAQIAFELAPTSGSTRVGLLEQQVHLFKSDYRLATRSDLCLGMSQAIARLNYILLRDYHNQSSPIERNKLPKHNLINPCLQMGSHVELSGEQVLRILEAPCLVASEIGADETLAPVFRGWLASRRPSLIFKGTGNVAECDRLLARLVHPAECSRYFALCPSDMVNRSALAPAGVPFVTISGYNKALDALELKPEPLDAGSSSELEIDIAQRLGGYSISYTEFTNKTASFCKVPVEEFKTKYPKIISHYRNVNCMQLVYIHRLLTDFYGFRENSTWSQLKFLLFPTGSTIGINPPSLDASDPNSGSSLAPISDSAASDIGWTLGLLLNATSNQMESGRASGQDPVIRYHHGSSVSFAIRSTIFLMIACFMIALSLILFAALAIRRHQASGRAYISHR